MSNLEKIGVSSLPQLAYLHRAQTGLQLTIMLVGSHGIGKTAFINTFIGQRLLNPQPFNETQNTRFWYLQDICNIQISHIELIEDTVKANITIIEVDGLGDSTDNHSCYAPAVELLERRLEEYQEELQESVPSLIVDKRVHVCFYFLEPQARISNADIDTMKQISEYTNIIPVVGKADLLNEKNITEISRNIREQIENNNIQPFEDSRLGYFAPFFIISASTVDDSQINERVYPWGTLNLVECQTNDLFRLRQLIFGENILKIFRETEYFYNRFRISSLAMDMIAEGNSEDSARIHRLIEMHQNEVAKIREKIRAKREALQKEAGQSK